MSILAARWVWADAPASAFHCLRGGSALASNPAARQPYVGQVLRQLQVAPALLQHRSISSFVVLRLSKVHLVGPQLVDLGLRTPNQKL